MSATNLRATLAAYAPLTALVSTRILSDRGEQTTQRPFVAFQLSETEYANTLSTDSTIVSETFSVACFADSRADSDAVADQVIAALKADFQNVTARVNDYAPEYDVHIVDVQVVWMD